MLIEAEAEVAGNGQGVPIQQVATELGVHKSTASPLLQTLVCKGSAVPASGSRSRFRLGPAVRILSSLRVDERRLRGVAHPFLQQLVHSTGECAHIAVVAWAWAPVIDDVETGQALRVAASRGHRVLLHCTSAGKRLLAYGLAVLPPVVPARTSRTITSARCYSCTSLRFYSVVTPSRMRKTSRTCAVSPRQSLTDPRALPSVALVSMDPL